MKPFIIYKIRSMHIGSEKKQAELKHLNEADGPVFKIYNDPRYTKIGRFLAHTGLDELPQLINILKGEMAFIGPRPLPINEADKVDRRYHLRFTVLPGITSPWVINGNHRLSFKEWMESDVNYVKQKSFLHDLAIAGRTCVLIIRYIYKTLKETAFNVTLTND